MGRRRNASIIEMWTQKGFENTINMKNKATITFALSDMLKSVIYEQVFHASRSKYHSFACIFYYYTWYCCGIVFLEGAAFEYRL